MAIGEGVSLLIQYNNRQGRRDSGPLKGAQNRVWPQPPGPEKEPCVVGVWGEIGESAVQKLKT